MVCFIKKYFTISFLTFLLAFSYTIQSQKNPNTVVRKYLRQIKKGKVDTLSALQKIVYVLDDIELKSKHKKKGVKELQNTYKIAVSSSDNEINTIVNNVVNHKNPYDTYQDYIKIINKYKQRYNFIASVKKLKEPISIKGLEKQDEVKQQINSYTEKREKARKDAAEYFYQKGKNSIENATQKRSYHDGYNYLLEAEKLISPYKDVINLKDIAKQKGAVYVKILPLQASSKTVRQSLNYAINNYVQTYDKSTPFLHVGLNTPNPDITVNFLVDAEKTKRYRPEPTTEVVKKTIKLNNEDKKIEVKATITSYEKGIETIIEGIAYLKDVKGNLIKKINIRGYKYWRDSWSTYTGDERALSKRQKRRLGKEIASPKESTIVNDAISNLKYNVEKVFKQLQTIIK